MTVTIDLTPAEQERVSAAARENGMDTAQFVKMLATREWPTSVSLSHPTPVNDRHFYFTASRNEFNEALDAVAQMNEHLPVLTEDAFDRENLYDDQY